MVPRARQPWHGLGQSPDLADISHSLLLRKWDGVSAELRARIYPSLLHQGFRGLCIQMLRVCCAGTRFLLQHLWTLVFVLFHKTAPTCVKGFSPAETLPGVTGRDTWCSSEKLNQAPKQVWAQTDISTPFVHPSVAWVLPRLAQLSCIWAWAQQELQWLVGLTSWNQQKGQHAPHVTNVSGQYQMFM